MYFSLAEILQIFLYTIFAFLIGSIPVGLIYSWAIAGIDIREYGSGNIGSTNVGRKFGFWKGFFPVFVMDFSKAASVILLFRYFTPIFLPYQEKSFFIIIDFLIAFAVILGNNFSIFLKFRGGKGIATSLGVFAILMPQLTIFCFFVFLFVYFSFGSRIVGRASVVTAFCAPIIAFFLGSNVWLIAILSLLLIFRHRDNIREWVGKN